MTTCRSGGPGAGAGAAAGPRVLGRDAEGCSFFRPYFLTGFQGLYWERSFLASPGWGTSFSLRQHHWQISALAPQLPSRWAGDGNDTVANPASSFSGIFSYWTGERKLQSGRFGLILLSDSRRRTGSKNEFAVQEMKAKMDCPAGKLVAHGECTSS